jgi:hypothetical protein
VDAQSRWQTSEEKYQDERDALRKLRAASLAIRNRDATDRQQCGRITWKMACLDLDQLAEDDAAGRQRILDGFFTDAAIDEPFLAVVFSVDWL